VRFWDKSAIVPLCVREPATAAGRELTRNDPAIVVWWATRTECMSAFQRRRREGDISVQVQEHARRALMALAAEWSEVLPTEELRRRAERLLAVHALRAAEAFQLAAALVWSQGETATRSLVSHDDRLREAASREGFQILPV
jgi:predicted nucleic acid-binding protein